MKNINYILIGFLLIFLVNQVSAAGPYTIGMKDISQRMFNGSANIFTIGDSITSAPSPRMLIGAVNNFKPVQWRGILPYANDVGFSIGWSPGNSTVNTPLPGTSLIDGTNGTWNVFGLREVNFTNISFVGQWLDEQGVSNSYLSNFSNDWTFNVNLTARYVYESDKNSANISIDVRNRNNSITVVNNTLTNQTKGIYWQDFTFYSGTGPFDIGISSETGGGITRGTNLMPVGHRIWNKNLSTGLEIGMQTGDGGWTAKTHLTGDLIAGQMSNYSDAALQRYLQAYDSNIFIVWLGENTVTSEWDGTNLINWTSDIVGVINRYTYAYYQINTTNARPYFILVSTYDTASNDPRKTLMENALINLTYKQGNYPNIGANASLGFVNLHRIINDTNGTYNNWQAVYTSDGVHPTIAGAYQFMYYFWNQSMLARTPKIGSYTPSFNPNTIIWTAQSATVTNSTSSSSFNNTDIYPQQLNLSFQVFGGPQFSEALVYDTTGNVSCTDIANCFVAALDNPSVMIPNQSTLYVIPYFNLTAGQTVANSPLWFGLVNASTVSVDSNLSVTINVSVGINVSSLGCNGISDIRYTSHTGAYQSNYTSNNWTCANNILIFKNEISIEPATGSNNFVLNLNNNPQGFDNSELSPTCSSLVTSFGTFGSLLGIIGMAVIMAFVVGAIVIFNIDMRIVLAGVISVGLGALLLIIFVSLITATC